MELVIRLRFVKTSEFRGLGGLNATNPPKPPRYATGRWTFRILTSSQEFLGISHPMQQSPSQTLRDLAGNCLKDYTGNRIMGTAWYSAEGDAFPFNSHVYLLPKFCF
jgi:hypothetical protein